MVVHEKDSHVVMQRGTMCLVTVKKNDTMADIRVQLDEDADDDMVVPDYLFQIGEIVLSKNEERNTLAWSAFMKEVVLYPAVLGRKQSNKSKAIVIKE